MVINDQFNPISCPRLQKWTIDQSFKINRICKHVANFKTPLPTFRVDVINVRSLMKLIQKLLLWIFYKI